MPLLVKIAHPALRAAEAIKTPSLCVNKNDPTGDVVLVLEVPTPRAPAMPGVNYYTVWRVNKGDGACSILSENDVRTQYLPFGGTVVLGGAEQ